MMSDGGVGVDRPGRSRAARSGPGRVTPIAHGSSSTQVSRVQSFTTCWSSCQAGRVAGDAAEHEPDAAASRSATRCRTPACSRGCRGCRAGSTPAPGRTRVAAGARRDAARTRQPMPIPNSALKTNCTVERCTSRDDERDADADATLTISASRRSLVVSQTIVKSRPGIAASTHPAPAAERLGQLGAHHRLDGLDRAGVGFCVDRLDGVGLGSWDQLVARVVHDPDAVVGADPALRPRSPGRARCRRSGAGRARPR